MLLWQTLYLDPGVELSAHDHHVLGLGQGVDGVTSAEGTASSPPFLLILWHYEMRVTDIQIDIRIEKEEEM